jgi:branched-chain amino acid transport system ATP-binding protein
LERRGASGADSRVERAGRIERKEEGRSREESLRVLKRVGLHDKADWAVSALPYGEQRLVGIARALAAEPKSLFLDDPPAGMNAAERGPLMERIASIRGLDVTVLLVEHDLQLVMDISDEIYVLDHGEIIAPGEPREVRANPKAIDVYVGVKREVSVAAGPAIPSEDRRTEAKTDGSEPQPLLSVDRLSTYYGVVGAVRDVSFDVYPEETLAILGSNGAGKTKLLRTVSGLLRPRAGKVLFDGRDITHMRPENISALEICQVPEGRLVLPTLSAHSDLQLGAATRRNKAEIRDSYDLVCTLFPRLAERRRQEAGTLLGGEQQMLALGR